MHHRNHVKTHTTGTYWSSLACQPLSNQSTLGKQMLNAEGYATFLLFDAFQPWYCGHAGASQVLSACFNDHSYVSVFCWGKEFNIDAFLRVSCSDVSSSRFWTPISNVSWKHLSRSPWRFLRYFDKALNSCGPMNHKNFAVPGPHYGWDSRKFWNRAVMSSSKADTALNAKVWCHT